MPPPTILFPEEDLDGFLDLDPPSASPIPMPLSGPGEMVLFGADETENYGLGTWLTLGAFAAAGALAYRYRNTLKKAFR